MARAEVKLILAYQRAENSFNQARTVRELETYERQALKLRDRLNDLGIARSGNDWIKS